MNDVEKLADALLRIESRLAALEHGQKELKDALRREGNQVARIYRERAEDMKEAMRALASMAEKIKGSGAS